MRIKWVKGHFRKNGTYVAPHLRTTPDKHTWNNLKPRPKSKRNKLKL